MGIKKLAGGMLIAVLLTGCQPAEEKTEGDQPVTVSQEDFYTDGQLIKMEINAYRGGGQSVILEDSVLLSRLQENLRQAVREPGVVSMTTPDYDVEAMYEDDESRKYQLWLGEEGQTSTWMMVEDTHTIYTTAPEMTGLLRSELEN